MKGAWVKSRHPSGLDLLFSEAAHTYRMNGGVGKLRSVSSVLGTYFPFDADGVSKSLSIKQGRPAKEILAEWRMSTVLGKNFHARVENKILGRPFGRPIELQGMEDRFYPVGEAAVDQLLAKYDVVAVEATVASPALRLAGTIDFIGRNKKTGQVLIADWKTTASSVSSFRYSSFEDPCPAPLQHLANNKSSRYALQVLTYGLLLRQEGYAKFYGEEVTALPMEYGIIRVGPSDKGDMQCDFLKVSPDAISPRLGACDVDPTWVLRKILEVPKGFAGK